MSKVSRFDVLKRMGEENKDIRIATNMLDMKAVKAGTQVKMGIAGNIIGQWMGGEISICLLVFNKKQFDELKAAMEKE